MLAHVVSQVGTVCRFKEESSNMDPKRGLEELSYSLQSSDPFSVSDVNPFMGSAAQDLSSSEILSCTLNSISLIEISEERDDEGNDKVRHDDVRLKFNDNVCLSPPKRSARVTKLNQKSLSRKAEKGCDKQVIKNKMLDSILSRVERKRRSHAGRPARSSVWGSNDISNFFEKTVSEVKKKRSKISEKNRGARECRKGKSDLVTGSQVSNRNTSSSFGHIRIKVKVGKEMGITCLKDMASVAENGLKIVQATGTKTHKITNFSGHNPNKEILEVNGTQCCIGDLGKVVVSSESLDKFPNKDFESSVTGEKSDGFVADNHQGITSPIDIEPSGVAVDNKYLDLGTSPDSEVINLIPDPQINGKDFHDILISSQTCVAPADILTPNSPLSCKKGKKKDSMPSAHDLYVQDGLVRPVILHNASVVKKCGQGGKLGDGLDSSGASISTNTTNLFSNTSSSKGSPGELLLSSKACDRKNIFPCTKKNKGRKHLKNSTPKQGSKSGSEVFGLPGSERGNACRKKGNAAQSVGKRKVKDKAACGEFARTVEDYHETGYMSLDVFEKAKPGDGNLAQEKLDAGVAHIDVPDQYISLRNAWACCDECFKWRRIPAILADSINETNSRWTCKENVDKDFADCSIPQEKSNSEINAELEISDASCEEDVCHGEFSPKRSNPNPLGGHKQSSWRLIKSNMFMHRSRKSQTIDEIMVCHCKQPTNGKLGCGNGCLNRMLNIECVKGTCPCGEFCSNQQFQKRKYAKLKWFRCGKKGYGLQLLEDISEGQFLIEYVGEVLDMQAYEARQRDYASQGHKHFYFMTLNGGEVIDACAKGNLGRFINHSCDPNCRTEKWMVNGEVSIGIFALKDLKKGDEVTFDYNYVRVFGAAAKTCVCGSSHCRGYIGGDPRDSEVIVQGDSDDELPEPVMVYDDGEVDDSFKKLISSVSPLRDAKASINNEQQVLTCEDKLERGKTIVERLESMKELRLGDVLANDDDKTDESANDVHHLEEICRNSGNENLQISFEVIEKSTEALQPTIQNLKFPCQLDIDPVSTISDPRQVTFSTLEAPAPTVVKKKRVSISSDTEKKNKYDKIGDRRAPKLRTLVKTSRSSISVKKGKSSNTNSGSLNKHEKIVSKSHGLSDKSKKIIESSATVEGKLNELLDDEGGISKRQDATKGYLKLLLLTAASGDSGSGEAIQSNRELSMILGAILKTQSRSVLVDVINKNGLQMLHNMLKRCRKDFGRIPILRKLLKVLEFLATKEILTKDLINKDPSCAGVESFRESILSLAEHDDKQVHQIARNFRDKWIPWYLRRSTDFYRSFNGNRHPSHNYWQDSPTRDTVDGNSLSIPATVPVSVDAVMNEVCSSGNVHPMSGTQSRKRKSRWDQPADSTKDSNSQVGFNQMNAIEKEKHLETKADDEGTNMDEDVPPGFAPHNVSCIDQGNDLPCKVELGHPQGKFMNRSAVSFGIPMPTVQQLGYPKTNSLEDWFVAPGIPFQPYPPLPTYSRNRSHVRDHKGNHQPAMSQFYHNPPNTYGSVPSNAEIQGINNHHNFQQARSSHGMGMYSRQQKWNNSRLSPPWKRNRNGWGFAGNDSRKRMHGGRHGSEGGNILEIDPNFYTHNP